VGFHPLETKNLEQKTIEAVGDLADNFDIMTQAALFSTLLAGQVDLLYGYFVIKPENNFAD
jgi:hypothetical protein